MLIRLPYLMMILALPISLLAQQLPVFYYSRITSTFDGMMPIGQKFQIKGVAEGNIVAVKIESIGFQGRIPETYSKDSGKSISELIERLKNGTNNSNVIFYQASWEKVSSDANAGQATYFSINHPQLYYGRNYVFIITYYQLVNNENIINLTKEEVQAALKGVDFNKMVADPGYIERIFRDLSKPFIDINKNRRKSLYDLLDKSDLVLIADYTTAKKSSEALREDSINLSKFICGGNSDSCFCANVKNYLGDLKNQFLQERCRLSVDNCLKDRKKDEAIKILASIRKNIGDLKGVGYSPENIEDQLVQKFVNKIPPENIKTLTVECRPAPYIETMKARYPYLISLDGGLLYAFRDLKKIVPSVSINIKINPKDFDDPFNQMPEFSAIIGLGFGALNDMSPNRFGIVDSTDKNALIIGLGLRFPSISPLLRMQGGFLIYRERDTQNYQNIQSKGEFYLGLSLNWDALDFAANLFKNRSNKGGF